MSLNDLDLKMTFWSNFDFDHINSLNVGDIQVVFFYCSTLTFTQSDGYKG